MSDYAFDYPAEADALAGNVDHLDTEYDSSGEYGYGDDLYSYGDEYVPATDPESPEFREAARQYGMEHVQDVIEHLVQTQLVPLHSQLESIVNEQQAAQGVEDAYDRLADYGIAEEDRGAVFDMVHQHTHEMAAQLGVDVPTFLQLMEQHAGVGNGSGEAAALMLLELGAAATTRATAPAADEFGVLRNYFPRGDDTSLIHGEPMPLGGQEPLPRGNEFSVLAKYFPKP
jgi:hypothetical protein